MAERLTNKNHEAINKCSEFSSCYSCRKEICYITEVCKKLGKLEDILEKYGIESMEELDNLIECCKTSSVLTEERIKEIAENEIRKTFQKNIQKIRETEYRVLLNELNTWQKACELACKWFKQTGFIGDQTEVDYYYQQAKKEGE